MQVTVLEPLMRDYDLFQGPLVTRRWQDNVAGLSDNAVKDYQEARKLVGQCAANLETNLSEPPQAPALRFASVTHTFRK